MAEVTGREDGHIHFVLAFLCWPRYQDKAVPTASPPIHSSSHSASWPGAMLRVRSSPWRDAEKRPEAPVPLAVMLL